MRYFGIETAVFGLFCHQSQTVQQRSTFPNVQFACRSHGKPWVRSLNITTCGKHRTGSSRTSVWEPLWPTLIWSRFTSHRTSKTIVCLLMRSMMDQELINAAKVAALNSLVTGMLGEVWEASVIPMAFVYAISVGSIGRSTEISGVRLRVTRRSCCNTVPEYHTQVSLVAQFIITSCEARVWYCWRIEMGTHGGF